MADVMVKKSLTPKARVVSEFNRDLILARLFDLPIPPRPTRGREFPIHTPLGRIMRLKHLRIRDVTRWEGAPNERLMTDYLAGRQRLPATHRGALARGLGVDGRLL